MSDQEKWAAFATDDHEYSNYEIRDRRGNVIATVYGRTDGQTKKPANLVAAAPDLLETLRRAEIVAMGSFNRPVHDPVRGEMIYPGAIAAEARAAITAALSQAEEPA